MRILPKSLWLRSSLSAILFITALPGLTAEILAISPSLELYGTFHSMGVIVIVDPASDPDRDAVASVEYRTGNDSFHPGFHLTRVDADRFVGSLFWLTPDTLYDVRVTLTDPDGGSLDGIILSDTASTRAELTFPNPQTTYYVSPNGSDNPPGDGSIEHPFASVARALEEAQEGDAVILRGGVYHQGDIDPPRSGLDNAPILIQGYPGETAVLDGADPTTFTWTPTSGGVYRTTLNVSNTHLIAVNGDRLYPYRSLSDLQNLIWEIPGFYVDGNDAYVRLENGADPNQQTMTVSRFSQAFELGVDNIYFYNLTFRHYGGGSYPKAIYINGGSGIVVDHCVFAMNDVGVALKRETHRNVVQHCEFYDTVFHWPWDAVKAGSGLETGGVYMYDPVTGRGNVIRYNTFHDFFDGLSCTPSQNAALTNETDVYENLFYRCGDDGVEVDGQSSNVRLWENEFYDVLAGISVAPVYTGPTYAIRNIIHKIGAGVHSYSGLSFKFNSGYDDSGAIYLFHNTCYAARDGSDGLTIHSPGAWTVIYSRNNVWSGMDYAISNSNTSQPIDFDYDLLFTEREGELVWWADIDDRHLETLEEVRTVLGIEAHGIHARPDFVNPSNGDFNLAPNSPLRDAGVILPGINDHFNGAGPDIGAIEAPDSIIKDWSVWQ